MSTKLVKIIRPSKLEQESLITFILDTDGHEIKYEGKILRGSTKYYINFHEENNGIIFKLLGINKSNFQEKLDIPIDNTGQWPYAATLEIIEKQLDGLEEYCIKSPVKSETPSSVIIKIRKKQPTKFNFKL